MDPVLEALGAPRPPEPSREALQRELASLDPGDGAGGRPDRRGGDLDTLFEALRGLGANLG